MPNKFSKVISSQRHAISSITIGTKEVTLFWDRFRNGSTIESFQTQWNINVAQNIMALYLFRKWVYIFKKMHIILKIIALVKELSTLAFTLVNDFQNGIELRLTIYDQRMLNLWILEMSPCFYVR